uniref:Uncharacterized protein n=1 Tax=Arundo donax TaxID=35708 RepID=A0A0A9DUQ4_ARUDO
MVVAQVQHAGEPRKPRDRRRERPVQLVGGQVQAGQRHEPPNPGRNLAGQQVVREVEGGELLQRRDGDRDQAGEAVVGQRERLELGKQGELGGEVPRERGVRELHGGHPPPAAVGARDPRPAAGVGVRVPPRPQRAAGIVGHRELERQQRQAVRVQRRRGRSQRRQHQHHRRRRHPRNRHRDGNGRFTKLQDCHCLGPR